MLSCDNSSHFKMHLIQGLYKLILPFFFVNSKYHFSYKNPRNFNHSWDLTLSILIIWFCAASRLHRFHSDDVCASASCVTTSFVWAVNALLANVTVISFELFQILPIYFNIIPLLLSFPPYIARNAILTVWTAYESHWKQMDFHIK